MRLNVGCGPFYTDGWWNLDTVSTIRCDQIVERARPLATFADDSAEAVYLGHILEHVPWHEVAGFLAEVLRVLIPGGQVCAVGPDIYRTVQRYAEGSEPWDIVLGVLDHADLDDPEWPGCQHQWTCHEERLVGALTAAGFVAVSAIPITPEATAGWPTVSHSLWQCGAIGTKA